MFSKHLNYLISALLLIGNSAAAQSFHGNSGLGSFYKVEISATCTCAICECTYNEMGILWTAGFGLSISTDENVYSLEQDLFIIDTLTGQAALYYDIPPNIPPLTGIASDEENIFYSMAQASVSNNLYKIDVANSTIINLGSTGYPCDSDLTFLNGDLYYIASGTPPFSDGIVKVDISDPSNSELISNVSFVSGGAITASNICNVLIVEDGFEPNSFLKYFNLIDQSLTPICESPSGFWYLTSKLELQLQNICDILLDLDCNDSSGATDADYNGEEFNCLSEPVAVSDDDIGMLYDAIIEEMTIEITGSIPDDPFEFLISTGSTPNIDISGDGTTMITLTNAGGAKSTDFKEALKLIRYNNTALLPTDGLRTVEVQFTTEAASMSNVAIAFIQVNELPLVPLDLGPDQEVCDGETATFDAGNPGATYEWSTGESTQTITVSSAGQYIVTVSDGINCPNQDTAELIVLPVIHVSLEGDQQICDNEQATLVINTNSPFPLTVEISSNPGSPFVFNNVTGTFTFNDLPAEDTEYTIISVTPSQPACVEITDPVQTIDVYPSYVHSFEASICDGDSIWLGFYWETEAGVYENAFQTFDGCDSIVTTTLSVLPAINISQQSTTCDSSQAGVFVEYLNNPTGCDTVVTTTVTLLPSDTTLLFSNSCQFSQTGVFTQVLSNQQGCDSLVITTINWTPPSDTTFIHQTSCDSSQLGVSQQILAAIDGCDSLVITSVTYATVDTTYSFATSCDSSQIGVTQQFYTDPQGCDSLVITTITASVPDTTYALATSCDSASLGVFEMHFVDQAGCDSVVFTTVTYSASDSTFLQSSSCDPSQTGVFLNAYVNRFGCDSVVITTVDLLTSHEIFIQSSTCDENQAGVFTDSLTNVNGCDSIVITTIELLPSDQTFLSGTTCRSSEAGTFITAHQNQYGCDSIVTLTVLLIPADTTTIAKQTCDPAEIGMIQNTFINQDGCDSLVIEETTLYPLPELQIETSDYNGYAISCFGENDGSANADATGMPPWTYLWSTGSDNQTVTGLSAGSYAVTVTDGNGCTTSGEVMLFEPEEFSISLIVSQPDCFDNQEGSITVEQTGGIAPIRYSIDEVNFQSSPVFNGLLGGIYTISAIDANECEVKEILWINVPLMVSVELGDDQQVFPGDSVVIHAIVNVPFDSLASITWSGLNNPSCPTCLFQPVAPIITTTYSVTVTSLDGCMDEDAMTLFLERDDDVYVPNVFSPNGDNINDELMIYTGSDVEKILEWVIFDRWGNVVFSANNFLHNDASISWDGTMKGKTLNPGVFAYRMIVEFRGGGQHVTYGDITLIR